MPRARVQSWQNRHPRVVGPLLTFTASQVGRLLEALGLHEAPGDYRRHGFAFRDCPLPGTPDHATFAVLADCLAVASAWRDFQQQAARRPTPGQQLAALADLRGKVADLRAALEGLDDASREALAGGTISRSVSRSGAAVFATRWWDDGLTRLRAELIDFDVTLGHAVDDTAAARRHTPPRDKWPGRVAWLWAARAVFGQHAAPSQRSSAAARRAFLRALADAARVPLPASDRVFDRLLARRPVDGLIQPTPRLR